MASVSLHAISKSYGNTSVLQRVSLDVEQGEFLTLLGPSGCGKSTLLRIIAGLEVQDAGTVAIDGHPVDRMRPKQRDVAMVFQSYALYPHMTVSANMALPLRMRRLSSWQRLPLIGRLLPGTRAISAQINEDVSRAATALEIGHVLDRKPGQLSGGQRQRVAVGRAMVRHPAVFLMDEPLSNLDAKLRVTMRAEIKELHRRLGATFIYVTHDQAEAMTLSDRVAVMLEGELLQVAPPRAIYADPVERRVAEFIGSPRINAIRGRVCEQGLIEVGGAMLEIETQREPGTVISVGIRPEALQLAARASHRTLPGRARFVEHLGSDLYAHLDGPGQSETLIVRLSADHADITVGEVLHLEVQSNQLLLFDREGRRIPARSTARPAARGPFAVAEATPFLRCAQ